MSIRTERVAAEIRRVLSETLARDIDTDDFGLLTVTEVSLSADLRNARVFVSHYHSGKSNQQVLAFFEQYAKELRMAVGRGVRLKFTPELKFVIDESLERAERLEQLFKQIHEDEKNR